MVVAPLFIAPGVGCLCLRELLHHNRAARIARPCHRKPVCISITRSNCVSLLLSIGRRIEPAQCHTGSRDWTHVWLCSFALTMASTPQFRTHPGIDGPAVLAAAL